MSASVRSTCPACRSVYRVPDSMIGKEMTCPKCKAKIVAKAIGGSTILELAGVDGRTPTALHTPKPVPPTEEYAPEEAAPSVRIEGRRPGRWSLSSVPMWGTFFILLGFFVAAVCWGGWSLYDRFYVQPRLDAMHQLHREWKTANAQAAYAQSLLGKATEDVQRDIRAVGENPESEWSRNFLKQAKVEDDHWSEQFKKNSELAQRLDERSKKEFGRPAAELPP